MVWSPLQYTKEIFDELKKLGYTTQVNFSGLEKAIMKTTLVYGAKTIKKIIIAFEKLGYLKRTTDGLWDIKYGKQEEKKPTKEDINQEAKKEVNEYEYLKG